MGWRLGRAGGGQDDTTGPSLGGRHRWPLALAALLIVGLVAAITLSARSGPPVTGFQVGPTFQASWACAHPTPGVAETASITVTGGTGPYSLDWTFDGVADRSDPVSRRPTTVSGLTGFVYDITVVPASSAATLAVRVRDSSNPPHSSDGILIGPRSACASQPPP